MATPAGAKRPASPAGGGPAAKVRVAKSPSGSVAKVAASPPAKASVAKSPVAKSPVAKAPVEKSSAPIVVGEEAAPRKDTWKEFANTDPLYALIGEVSQHKVMEADGELNQERLDRYLEIMLVQGAAKKTKDWIEVWAAMDIPVSHQAAVLTPIMTFGLAHKPESMGMIVADLLKGHRVKTKTIEEAVAGSFMGQPDPYGVLPTFLYQVFPKSPQSEWGWSRVGWSWSEWWKIAESCFNGIEKSSAFDGLGCLLDRIEESGKMPLVKQSALWNEKRLGQVRSVLCRYGELEDEADLIACVDATLK